MIKRQRKPTTKSRAEELLAGDFKAMGDLPKPYRELYVTPNAAYRFDFAWPAIKLAVEVNGRGRHQTEKGEREDNQKINLATELGWRVLIYPARSVTVAKRRARIVDQVRRVICNVRCEESALYVLNGD